VRWCYVHTIAYPTVREDDLLVEECDGGLLIYDTRDHVAHALEGDSVPVWRNLDGHRSITRVAERCELSESTVTEIVARLHALGLLVDETPEAGDISRRAALRRAAKLGAVAAVAAPLAITTIAVPSAMASASSDCGLNGANAACTAFFSDAGCTDRVFDLCQTDYGASCGCVVTGVCTPNGGNYKQTGTCA
jgi:hypothetical protein